MNSTGRLGAVGIKAADHPFSALGLEKAAKTNHCLMERSLDSVYPHNPSSKWPKIAISRDHFGMRREGQLPLEILNFSSYSKDIFDTFHFCLCL